MTPGPPTAARADRVYVTFYTFESRRCRSTEGGALTPNLTVRASNLDRSVGSSVVHHGGVRTGLTIWQKATIALLLIWAVTLLIEVPYGTIFQLIPRRGVAASIGPVALEAVFVSLMV